VDQEGVVGSTAPGDEVWQNRLARLEMSAPRYGWPRTENRRMRGAKTVGANQDAWADDMAQVNRMGAEGAERRQVIVLASIARSLAVIADHLTEG
jgi:hypothetical protein